MNKMEEEVVYLSAVIELLRSMVNYELMVIQGEGNHKNVQFKTMTHRRFFFITLVDFLSQTDSKAPVPKVPYLAALRAVGDTPTFNVNGSVLSLKKAVSAFTEWLHTEIPVETWLPSIDRQVELRLSRYLLLKIVGDLSKHNTLRSVSVAVELQSLFQKAGENVELYEAMLAQEDIYEILHDDVCAYHASTIAEFLNELSWGIQDYLRPEYSRSFTPEGGDSPVYKFLYPEPLVHPYAKTCYWNVMNQIRSKPIFSRFQVTEHLKGRY
jgi:hypothetical protein